ncbi:hypothetical protein NPIL_414591 [Nephila pilipes]|uniref:Uncharacterized protein n=1 Tax=Nephila pilipes TaxID=299642 RepID=A0A8X6TM89_NEPPI|nr:hypothetical protein NPIL_414591 [Nephila pilipes]
MSNENKLSANITRKYQRRRKSVLIHPTRHTDQLDEPEPFNRIFWRYRNGIISLSAAPPRGNGWAERKAQDATHVKRRQGDAKGLIRKHDDRFARDV